PDTGEKKTIDTPIRARFSASAADVTAHVDATVMESVIEQTTRERVNQAVALRDQGRLEEARALLSKNQDEINAYLANNKSDSLANLGRSYDNLLPMFLSPGQWGVQRKIMRQMDMKSGAVPGARY